jgi:hypothetical protein
MNIVTIATGDYYIGAAGLINSLASVGFTGKITVGYQGSLPWKLAAHCRVETLELKPSRQKAATNLKAELIKQVGSGDIVYMDSDCIVTSPKLLSLVAEFIEQGPMFCVEGILPASDVRHLTWEKALRELGLNVPSKPLANCLPYLNAGFFALRLPRDASILGTWYELIDKALLGEGDAYNTPFFPMVDQDCLNAVVANYQSPYSTLGAPDIWYKALPLSPFSVVGVSTTPLFLHCTGLQKPWRLKSPPLDRPDIYDKFFYRHTFLETPWVTLPNKLSPKVASWIEDGLGSRLNLRVRKGTARISNIIERGRARLKHRAANV